MEHFSVEMRSLLGKVITRLPYKLPLTGSPGKIRRLLTVLVLLSLFVLSEVLKEVVMKMNQRMSYTDAKFLVYKERHVSSSY